MERRINRNRSRCGSQTTSDRMAPISMGLKLMRHIYGFGCTSAVAFVFSSVAASAQVGVAPPAGMPVGGASIGVLSEFGAGMGESGATVPKRVAPSAPKRTPRFNRLTSTQTQVVPMPSQGATPARSNSAASRSAGIPAGSTWRKELPPSRPPATTVRSAARNYYPGLRPGVHPNADRAQVRARGNQFGLGSGIGVGGLSSGAGVRRALALG